MDITKMQQKVSEYLLQAQYSEAIALCEQCINANPTLMFNYWYLGLAWLLQGEVLEAQAIWLSAVAQGTPEEVDVWMAELIRVLKAEAIQYLYNHKLQLATEVYWQILELDSNQAEIHYNLGHALAEQGNYDEAVASWQRSIDLKPDFANAYQNQGCVFQKLEEFEEAIICYSKTLEIQPDQPEIHYNLGLCFSRKGSLDKATTCFKKAIQLQPEFAPVHSDLGNALLQKGNLLKAVTSFKKAIQLQPAFALAYCNWIDNLSEQRQFNELINYKFDLLKALHRQQDSAKLYFYLGNVLVGENQFDTGILSYKEAIETKVESYELYFALGKALAVQGNFDEAINCYKKALAIQPKSPEAYFYFGNSLVGKEKFDEAINYYQEALIIDPGSSKFYFHLGSTLLAVGKFDEAITSLQKSLELQPKATDTYCNLGIAFAESNNTDEAIACFQKAIEINPDLANILYNLIITLGKQGKLDVTTATCQQILPIDPPNGFYETTWDWAVASSLETSNYTNIYPESIIHLRPPATPGNSIHFSFRFGTQVALPASFVAVVPDGRYWLNKRQSSMAIITADNQLLGDVSTEFPIYSPGHPDKHPSKHSIFSLKKLPPVQSIDGTVAVLSGLFNEVYFHWMFDILPRFELLSKSGIELNYIDKYLINSRLSYQRETLKVIGIPEEKILETNSYPHIKATKLVVPSFPGSVSWMPKWVCSFLRSTFLNPKLIEASEKIERIYISRKKTAHRRVINEEEVISFLSKFGFKSVTLESMSVAEQASLLANAKVVVAPHGGGLTNTVFCSPGTKVIDIFTPYYVYPCYWLVSNLVDFEYYYLLGEVLPGLSLHKLIYPNQWLEDIFVNINDLSNIMKFAGVI